VGLIVAIVVVHHVVHGAVVSLTEAFAEIVASAFLDWGVFIHFVVIGIGVAMLADVVAGRFDALVKAAALCIAIFRWRLVPPVMIMVLRQGRTGNRLCFVSAGFERTSRSDTESKQGWCEPFYFVHIGTSTFMA
jgi:hypothetical protein